MDKTTITKEDIAEVENKLSLAQLVSDVAVLDHLLHDDLVAVAPTGQIVTKEMDLNAHRSKTMTIEDASTVIDELNEYALKVHRF